MILRRLIILFFLLMPGSVAAHPHVYIDATLKLVYDEQGDLSGVRVEWVYDDFYSLLIIEDYGLDPDGDSKLTPAESDIIQGFDADWAPDSAGGLYLNTQGKPVMLGAPENFSAEYIDGQLVSRHFRSLPKSLPGETLLTVKVYDPEFYVDFSVSTPPVTEGRDCQVELIQGDAQAAPDAYLKAVEEALGEGTDTAEADIITVDIGAAGADEMHINCAKTADQ